MIRQYEPILDIAELNTEFVFYLQRGGYITEYKKTEEFENKIKEFLGVKYCSVVNNGTISLSLALLACGIKPGDKVLVPNLTMIATANAVRFIGAIPIFVDIDLYRLCMDLDNAYNKLSKNTKALIYVTLNGRSINPSYIEDFCNRNHLKYISDDAQAFGSCYPIGDKIGTHGDISSFSFSMPKIITTGQGGCLVTNNDELGKKIKLLKDFGRTGGGNDVHNEFGINCKFTELQAIVGLSQLRTINTRINTKKYIYNLYYQELKNIFDIEFLDTNTEYVTPWFVDIYINNRTKLIEYLKENKIETRPIYSSINKQLCYKEHPQYNTDFLSTQYYANRGLWLPSSMNLKESDILFICSKIKEFYK